MSENVPEMTSDGESDHGSDLVDFIVPDEVVEEVEPMVTNPLVDIDPSNIIESGCKRQRKKPQRYEETAEFKKAYQKALEAEQKRLQRRYRRSKKAHDDDDDDDEEEDTEGEDLGSEDTDSEPDEDASSDSEFVPEPEEEEEEEEQDSGDDEEEEAEPTEDKVPPEVPSEIEVPPQVLSEEVANSPVHKKRKAQVPSLDET